MSRRKAMLAFVVVAALPSVPAAAYWHAGGSGTGTGTVATMPAGPQPSGTVSGQNVTLTWSQNTFQGSLLGTFTRGGYKLTRYAAGGTTPITPNAACATTISGSNATLQCIEATVPYGAWQYSVTPVLSTFTGAESAKSTTVTVATTAPSLSSVTAQNPAAGLSIGDVQLAWGSVTGATGYDVYRRTSAGSYNFASALNGATPVTATTYTDPGIGLTGGTTYEYVVRAVAGSPTVESVNSNELGATAIARPAAPSGAVTATAVVAAHISVSWTAVSGVAGYNVYRRTSAGSYNFATPVNGASVVATATYDDATAVNGTTYLYTVRSVITGAGSAEVESTNSSESGSATADSTAPPAPAAVTVNSGGNVKSGTSCSVTSGTRFIDAAGQSSVSVTATITAAEAGESVVFTATTAGSTPVTVSAAATTGATSAATTMNLTSLLDGTVTLTARTKDMAGNLSATTSPANVITKDVIGGALSNLVYHNSALVFADTMSGDSECGATITATETTPHSNVYTTTVGSGGSFSGMTIDALSLTSYSYNVTATDLAGNTSAILVLSGTALL